MFRAYFGFPFIAWPSASNQRRSIQTALRTSAAHWSSSFGGSAWSQNWISASPCA